MERALKWEGAWNIEELEAAKCIWNRVFHENGGLEKKVQTR